MKIELNIPAHVLEAISEMDSYYRIQIYDALFCFLYTGAKPELTGAIKACFNLIVEQIEVKHL